MQQQQADKMQQQQADKMQQQTDKMQQHPADKMQQHPADKMQQQQADKMQQQAQQQTADKLQQQQADKKQQQTQAAAWKPPNVPLAAAKENEFTCCSWNILATTYSLSPNFAWVEQGVLQNERRLKCIGEIISQANCDLISLQEVDQPVFVSSLLHARGYKTFFCQRQGKKPDGLLLAWKKSKFQLVDDVEANAVALNASTSAVVVDLNDLKHAVQSHLYYKYVRNNVAAFVLLRLVDNAAPSKAASAQQQLASEKKSPLESAGRLVLFATTHLYWNPNHEDVKLYQIVYFLNKIEQFVKARPSKQIAVVLTGDLNSTPNSDVYKFIAEGKTQPIQSFLYKRLLVDANLHRVVRMLRAIGVDAEYFPNTAGGFKELFERARTSSRTIVTNSKTLTVRKDCPSHFLVTERRPREVFKQVIRHFSFQLDVNKFYSRCVRCNSPFSEIPIEALKSARSVPEPLRKGKDRDGNPIRFYQCVPCRRVYWWGDIIVDSIKKFERIFSETSLPTINALPAQAATPTKDEKQSGKDEKKAIDTTTTTQATPTSPASSDAKVSAIADDFIFSQPDLLDDDPLFEDEEKEKKKAPRKPKTPAAKQQKNTSPKNKKKAAAQQPSASAAPSSSPLPSLVPLNVASEPASPTKPLALQRQRSYSDDETLELGFSRLSASRTPQQPQQPKGKPSGQPHTRSLSSGNNKNGNSSLKATAAESQPTLTLSWEHGLALASAFKADEAEHATRFTNITPFFKGWIDYIFSSSQQVRLEESSRAYVSPKPVPTLAWPSDHLMLQAKFALLNKN